MVEGFGRFARRLALVTGAALAWKLVYVAYWKYGDRDLTDEGDALYYGSQARLNAAGRWFTHPEHPGPGADHPPLTSLVLTPAAWITDGSILAMRMTMVVLGVFVVIGVGLLGRRVGGDRAGLVAAGLAGAYAALWVNDALLMSETLAALGTVAVLVTGYRLVDVPTPTNAVLVGVAGGFAALARAELALLLPLVVLAVAVHAWRGGYRPRALVGVVAAAAAAGAVVVAPWVGWNLARFEEPVLLSSNDGLTLIGANCHDTYFTPAIGFWQLRCALDRPVNGDRSEVAREWRREAIDYATDHVDRLPAVVAARVGRTFGVYEPRQMVYFNGNEGREAWVSWLALYQYWALVPLASAGAVIARRRGWFLAPLGAPVVVVTLVSVVFYGISRFRVPVDVVLVVLAAVAVDAAITAASGHDRPGRSGTRP